MRVMIDAADLQLITRNLFFVQQVHCKGTKKIDYSSEMQVHQASVARQASPT